MKSHTPGPFSVQPFKREDGQGVAVCHNGDKPIAWLYQSSPNAFGETRPVPLNQLANADLFAAAPDLLELLERIELNNALKSDSVGKALLTEVRAAIKKAEGAE
jgi:hypothetical protein